MDFTTLIKQLYAVDKLEGYNEEEIKQLKEIYGALPDMLENFYRTSGRTPVLNCGQDIWIMPEYREKWSWLAKSSHFILLNENQGVCQAGIRPEDMNKPDPPVYVCMDDKDWKLCAPTVSEFLAAALAYEAVFTFDYSPEEFYWLSKESYNKLRLVLENIGEPL